MAVAVAPPSKRLRAPTRGFWLWYGIVSGPVHWMIHITAVAAFASGSCHHHWEQWAAHGMTVFNGAATALAIVISALVLRDAAESRYRFLGWFGVGTGALSLFLILLEEVIVWTVRVCG
jgi:hypothetical protein